MKQKIRRMPHFIPLFILAVAMTVSQVALMKNSYAQNVDYSALTNETTKSKAGSIAGLDDETNRKSRQTDFESYVNHKVWQREFEHKTWEWHLLSTKIIFFVVTLIVLFGLRLTYLQFMRDGHQTKSRRKLSDRTEASTTVSNDDGLGKPGEAKPLDTGTASTGNRIKVGLDGFEITSQVIGLLVLMLSLAFFYLYLKQVYPIFEEDKKIKAGQIGPRNAIDEPTSAEKNSSSIK